MGNSSSQGYVPIEIIPQADRARFAVSSNVAKEKIGIFISGCMATVCFLIFAVFTFQEGHENMVHGTYVSVIALAIVWGVLIYRIYKKDRNNDQTVSDTIHMPVRFNVGRLMVWRGHNRNEDTNQEEVSTEAATSRVELFSLPERNIPPVMV